MGPDAFPGLTSPRNLIPIPNLEKWYMESERDCSLPVESRIWKRPLNECQTFLVPPAIPFLMVPKTLLRPGPLLWVSSQLSQKHSTHHQDHSSGLGPSSPEPGGTIPSSSLDPVLLLMGPGVFADLVSQDFFTRAASPRPTCFCRVECLVLGTSHLSLSNLISLALARGIEWGEN